MERPKIKFNGREYEAVPVNEFTMDECMVLWDYAQMGPDQVGEIDGFHPGFTSALIHIAVARKESEVSAREIRRLIGALPWVELAQVFEAVSVEADDSGPPAGQPDDERSDAGQTGTSGEVSSHTSAPLRAAIEASGSGAPRSDISATSAREKSAA